MLSKCTIEARSAVKFAQTAAVIAALCIPAAFAQDRDGDRDHERLTRIERGTMISVRTDETIQADQAGDRIYHGVVDQDVRGENGRLAIPRGARVELKVKTAPDNDLVLDLEAVNVNGDRFRLETDPDRVPSQQQGGLLGAIVGQVTGVQVRGRAVNVPRDTILNFRLDHSMVVDAVHRD